MKNKNEYKSNENLFYTFFVCGIILFVLGLFIGLNITSEPQGIGGFVYKEIEWADQTYNIIKENDCSYIDYNSIEKKIYCRHKECKGDYCRYDNLYFHVNEVGS